MTDLHDRVINLLDDLGMSGGAAVGATIEAHAKPIPHTDITATFSQWDVDDVVAILRAAGIDSPEMARWAKIDADPHEIRIACHARRHHADGTLAWADDGAPLYDLVERTIAREATEHDLAAASDG